MAPPAQLSSDPSAARLERCFVALTLPTEVLDALVGAQRKLAAHAKAQGATCDLVPRRYLHLTLDDLGRCPPGSDEAVALAIERLLRAHDPFTVPFGGLDGFPEASAPRLVYVRVRDEQGRLKALREALHAELLRYGFDVDPRPFLPHVALARVDTRFGPAPSVRITAPDLKVRQIAFFRQAPPTHTGPRFERAWSQTLVRFPPAPVKYPSEAALEAEISRQLDARLAHHTAQAPRGRKRRPVTDVQEA